MSYSDNDNDCDEILESRGLNKILRLRGYTPYAYQDRSRDTLSAVDLWDLDLRVFLKNKRFIQYIHLDYPRDYVPAVSGDDSHTIGIHKDQRYYDSEVLYVPYRLRGTRYHNIPESELDIYRDESKEEGILWQGPISGLSPVRELMEKQHPLLMQASHPIIRDQELTEQSEFNTDPSNRESHEVFYKPVQNCNKWDCPLPGCRQTEKFVEEWRSAKKLTYHYLRGLPLNHLRNKRHDKLHNMLRIAKTLHMMTLLDAATPINPLIEKIMLEERLREEEGEEKRKG